MAVVKGLNLETIKTLGKAVTFSNWKGLMVAKARMKKIGPNRSPRVTVMNNRYKVACYYLKTLSAEVIDLWKEYTNETDWTWKDAFISAFLRAWAESNTPPIVVTELSFNWGSPIAELTFAFADWYYGFDFGYGTDGYGRCPYGTPTSLTINQPHEQTVKYLFRYTHPKPTPYETFHGSPKNLGCKKPPEVRTKKINTPDNTITPPPTEIKITRTSSIAESSGWWKKPTCLEAFEAAWEDMIFGPTTTPALVAGSIFLASRVAGADTEVDCTTVISFHTLDFEDVVTDATWYKVDKIRLHFEWHGAGDPAPWKIIATVIGADAVEISANAPFIDFPVPSSIWDTKTIVFENNEEKPAAPCPPPATDSAQIRSVAKAEIVWKTQQPQNANEDSDPASPPCGLQPIGKITDWPIIGPLLDLIFPV